MWHRAPFTAGHDERTAHGLDEPGDGTLAGHIVRVHLPAVHQQRAPAQRRLALPQAHQGRQFAWIERDGLRRHHVQLETQRGTGCGSDRPLAGSFFAAQLDNGQRSVTRTLGPRCDQSFRRCPMRWHQAVRRQKWVQVGHTSDETHQSLVQVLHAGEIVQHSLVYPQRAVGETITGLHLDQAPKAQCTGGRKGAPVRLWQNCQRQAKGGISSSRISLSGSAQ